MKFQNLQEIKSKALTILDDNARNYYCSGACDEVTLSANQMAYQNIELLFRVMVDVSRIDTSVDILGTRLSMPVLIAPTAFHGLAHQDKELATARAAKKRGCLFINSTLSNTAVEDIGPIAPFWFQLYVYRDRVLTKELIERAEAAGATAVVLTVDAPVLGLRETDSRKSFVLPSHLTCANLESYNFTEIYQADDGSGLANHVGKLHDASLTWKDIEWMRSISKLPIIVKGVVHPEDARIATESGASGIVVSNHGGRQLDTSISTIEALQRISQTFDSKHLLLVDGGIRRGTDIVKALAAGADAVLIGRPVLWGLTVGGQSGVEKVLETLRKEFENAMALCGVTSIDKISKDLLVKKAG